MNPDPTVVLFHCHSLLLNITPLTPRLYQDTPGSEFMEGGVLLPETY